MTSPRVSFVIPIFNEEPILHAAIVELHENLAPLELDYEIVLAENGSRDGTLRVADKLAAKYREVRYLSVPEPNYGAALREGIERARGEIVICEEIDLCDVDFHKRALQILDADQADLVIGSKLLPDAEDVRPKTRHAASLLYSSMLRVGLGFRGTDTHGLKAMKRERLLPVVRACIVDKDVFASELVLRAQRADVRIVEIPVRVLEKRTPTINLVSRVPGVLSRVGRLWWALRSEP
ncbi:MAG: glycosyltransferase family 2 protein [Polyangiaceae bacterium]|nr:glycosyltransferase family 2 protein [Polyangiaceae bacterium]